MNKSKLEEEFDRRFTCIVGWEKWPDEEQAQKLPHAEYRWTDEARDNPKMVRAFFLDFLSSLQKEIEGLGGEIFCNCRGRDYEQTLKGYRGFCRTCKKLIDDEQRARLQHLAQKREEKR